MERDGRRERWRERREGDNVRESNGRLWGELWRVTLQDTESWPSTKGQAGEMCGTCWYKDVHVSAASNVGNSCLLTTCSGWHYRLKASHTVLPCCSVVTVNTSACASQTGVEEVSYCMKQMLIGLNNDKVCVFFFYFNFKHVQSVSLLKLSEEDVVQFLT